MRQHQFEERHNELVAIIKDYPAWDLTVDLRLRVGDVDFSEELESGDWGVQADSAPTWTMQASVDSRIPTPSLLNAPARLEFDIGGIVMTAFEGVATQPVGNSDWSSQIVSYTPGTYLDATTLDEYVTFNEEKPQNVIRKTVQRVSYSRGLIRIPNFDKPLISRGAGVGDVSGTDDAAGFEDESSPRAILDSVMPEIGGVYFDTVLGGFVCALDPGLGAGSQAVWAYDADSQELLEPFEEPTWSLPDEQYSRVVARDKSDVAGEYFRYGEWPVDYSMLAYPPKVNNTLYIPATDTSLSGQLAARDQAHKEAMRLRHGEYTGSITVAFNPLLEPFDVVTLSEQFEDRSGRYRRQWRMVILGISHSFDQTSMSTILDYRAGIVFAEKLGAPRILVGDVSPGVVAPVA